MSLNPLPPDQPVVQQTPDAQSRLHNPLYLPARAIKPEEFGQPELKALVAQMRDKMHATGGIGISANQVGRRLQVFVIEAHASNPRYQVLGAVPYELFINPRIVAASAERRNFWHGCLSAVGQPRGNVATYEWVEVEAADLTGHRRQERLGGLAAVIFQHELRHMLGGTYLDYAKDFLEKSELDQKLAQNKVPFFERAEDSLPLLVGDYRIGDSLEDYYRGKNREQYK